MADSHSRRRSGRARPYGLAVVALLLVGAAMACERKEPDYVVPADVAKVPPANTVLALTLVESRRFAAFAGSAPDFGEMNQAHEYARNGFRYLAAALHELEGDSSALAGRVAALREGAARLSTAGTAHARMFAVLAAQSADAIADLQRERLGFLRSEGLRVRVAADAVDADKPLLEQEEIMTAFFRAASAAVVRLGASAPSGPRS